jgi:hypothetical protein
MTTTNQSQQPVATNPDTYYVFDYSRLSFAEIWSQRGLNPFRILFLANILVGKFTHRPRRGGVPTLYENNKHIEFNEIPERVLSDIAPVIRSLQSAGYAVRLVQTGTKSKGSLGYGVHLLSADRLSVANVVFAQVIGVRHTRVETAVSIATRRQNGRMLITSNAPARIKSPPECQIKRFVGVPAEQLVGHHRQRLLNCTDAVVVREGEFAERARAFLRRFNEFQIGRGFHAPANSEEMGRYRDQIVAPGFFETPQ